MKKKFAAVCALCLAYFSVPTTNASWNTTEFRNFTVEVQYKDYAYLNAVGDPVYNRNMTVAYRVIIHNNGHRPFRNLPVKATLVWDRDATCIRTWSDNLPQVQPALQPLPGNPSAGPYQLTLAGESYSFFDAFYTVPNTVCPDSVRIQLDAGRDNGEPPLLLSQGFLIQ